MLDVPVAFIIFNRPHCTEASFQPIRAARPRQLFVISDAARPDREGEAEQVRQSRAVVENIDWPCEVHRIYAQQNMGCGHRISSGITMAMQIVDRLIVLEDDCVAGASWFSFCDELLRRYEPDQRVMSVSGTNFQQGRRRSDASYYFSKYTHCWGWATWRRAWDHFDLKISHWPSFRDAGHLRAVCDSPREIDYWTQVFDNVHAGRSQSWAYPWTLACWMNHGLTVLPEVNLISNVGFGASATHTRRSSAATNLVAAELNHIVHPLHVHRHIAADQFSDDVLFSGTRRRGPIARIENAIRGLRKPLAKSRVQSH